MTIVPAILTDSFEDVNHKLFLLEGLSEWVQIDICDGVFGVERTWLPMKGEELPHGFLYEFDLMVKDWRKYVPRVIALGAKRIVMHIDDMSEDDIEEMLEMVRPHNVYLGICISNDKNVPDFAAKIHSIEARYTKLFIQVMGIRHIGTQGQPFDETSVRRIRYLYEECRNMEIQVDGAMNEETIPQVRNAGARTAVVGSSIFGHNANQSMVKKNFDKLVKNFA